MTMRLTVLYVWIVICAPAYANQAPFHSLLKLKIHQQVQSIRADQEEIVQYLLESNVRKVQVDYVMALRKKGFSYEEIQEIFQTPPYQNLFNRVRENPTLQAQAQNFVQRLTSPYYLEERAIDKHIEIADTYKGYQQQAYQNAGLSLQRNIRKVKTQKPLPQTFWGKLHQSVKRFLGLPV